MNTPTGPKSISIHCAFTELRDPASLIAHPKNPNKHPVEQIRVLAKIISHQGWRNPIVVSARSGFVIAGHGRLAAAIILGVATVPVDLQDFETEADEWAHLVADNRIAELAEMEKDALDQLLRDIEATGLDLDLTGFDSIDEGPDVGGKPDAAGEVPFSEIIGECSNYVVLVFNHEIDWLQAETHFDLSTVQNRRQNGKPWSKGVGRVIDGAAYLRKVSKEVSGV